MITAATLKVRTAKDLAVMAKKQGVAGWHSMRKDQLVRALLRSARARAAKGKPPLGKSSSKQGQVPARRLSTTRSNASSIRKKAAAAQASAPKPTQSPLVRKRLEAVRNKLADVKNLATSSAGSDDVKERLVLLVRDPYWLHVHWQIAPRSVQRAKSAMNHMWHTAKPTLLLFEVNDPGATRSESCMVRKIEVHGGVSDWYLDVNDPPKSFCVELGYLATDGSFHRLARSNGVTTPATRGGDSFERHWDEESNQFDRVYAMSGGGCESTDVQELLEQRLGRPMGSPMVTRFGSGAKGLLDRNGYFEFDVDAELIVYGNTRSDAYVTVKGEPVQLCPDGTFSMRFNLPNKRQVIPVVANSCDGVEQRTILLAIERNTKVMDPVIREIAK